MPSEPEQRAVMHMSAIAVAWAVLGWSAVLAFAILRLGANALEAFDGGLDGLQWSVLVLNSLLLAWAEGYRGFQRRFSPRAAARVLYLRDHVTPLTALLAPVFCVGFFAASARVLRLTWVGTALIVAVVVAVRQLDQPWRGILDAGVVVGLAWGLVSFLLMTARALATGSYPAAPEVPGRTVAAGL